MNQTTRVVTAEEREVFDKALRESGKVVGSAPALTRAPSGYAYRYPDGLRFNNGCEVNGSRPSEVVPYWLGSAPAEPPRLPNNDEVICPACCHQFRAIPVNVQKQLEEPPIDRDEIERLRAELENTQRQLGECSGGYQTLEREVATLLAEQSAMIENVRFARERAERAEAETLEQAKLLAAGGERDARLMARCEELRKDAERLIEAGKNVLETRYKECRAQAALTVAKDNYASGYEQEEKAWIAAAIKASEAEKKLGALVFIDAAMTRERST